MTIHNNGSLGTRTLGERGLGMKGTVHRINRKGASCSLIGTICKKDPLHPPAAGFFMLVR